MKAWVRMVVAVGVACLSLSASAQVAREVGEAAIDEQVEVELNDGSSVRGRMMGASDAIFVVRVRSGRLVEIPRENINTVFVDVPETTERSREETSEASPPAEEPPSEQSSPQGPPAAQPPAEPPPESRPSVLDGLRQNPFGDDFVTDAEYEAAASHYYPARRLKVFGFITMGLGGLASVVGSFAQADYANGCAYDDGGYCSGCDDGCGDTARRLRTAMFVVGPTLLASGLTMTIIGGKKKRQYAPTIRRYVKQRHELRRLKHLREEHIRECVPHQRGGCDHPDAVKGYYGEADTGPTLALSPVFHRAGGGLRLNLSF